MFTSLFYSFPRQFYFWRCYHGMWEKSFVFKNGCMYVLDHLSYKVILENQKSYNNIQSSRILFSWMCKKPWGTHTKKTGNKLERSLVPFHIRSQMTQMHRCYSKCVCVSLERHCSWPSRIDRYYLVIFRTLNSERNYSQSFCFEYGLGYTILSAFSYIHPYIHIYFI